MNYYSTLFLRRYTFFFFTKTGFAASEEEHSFNTISKFLLPRIASLKVVASLTAFIGGNFDSFGTGYTACEESKPSYGFGFFLKYRAFCNLYSERYPFQYTDHRGAMPQTQPPAGYLSNKQVTLHQ